MEENKKTGKLDFISYAVVLFIGLLSFSFGGGTMATAFAAVGFMIAVMLFMVVGEKIKKNGKLSFLASSLPLLVFFILISFNRFWLNGTLSSFFGSLIILLGLIGSYVLGFSLKKHDKLTPKMIGLAIIMGSSLYVLINMIINIVDYGFFYVSNYGGMVYYDDGVAYAISSEMESLISFNVRKTSLPYSSTLSFMLASSLPSLLFMDLSKKEEEKEGNWLSKNLDRIYAISILSGGLIGLFSLVFLPYMTALVAWVVVLVLAVAMKIIPYKKELRRWVKILGWAILGVAIILLALFAINGLSGKLDNRLFNNSLLRGNLPVFKAIFENDNGIKSVLLGANLNDYYGKVDSAPVGSIQATSFEFEALLEGGLLCFAALLVALIFAVISIRKFLHKGEKIEMESMVLALLLIGWFIYKSLFVDTVPFINSNIYMSPFSHDSTILLAVLLLGYTYEDVISIKEKGAKLDEAK